MKKKVIPPPPVARCPFCDSLDVDDVAGLCLTCNTYSQEMTAEWRLKQNARKIFNPAQGFRAYKAASVQYHGSRRFG